MLAGTIEQFHIVPKSTTARSYGNQYSLVRVNVCSNTSRHQSTACKRMTASNYGAERKREFNYRLQPVFISAQCAGDTRRRRRRTRRRFLSLSPLLRLSVPSSSPSACLPDPAARPRHSTTTKLASRVEQSLRLLMETDTSNR